MNKAAITSLFFCMVLILFSAGVLAGERSDSLNVEKDYTSVVKKYDDNLKTRNKKIFYQTALDLRCWIESNDSHRPIYHTMAPDGFTFDVNGPIYYDGEYHLFYLNNKQGGTWRGHMTSSDLVYWKDWPFAMWPDTPWEGNSVFSGNQVIDDNGIPTFIYTGNSNHQTAKGILARSHDGMLNWSKKLIMDKPPYPGTPVHWDAQIWKDNGIWYQLCGGTYSDKGAAVLWSSQDLENWEYCNRIYESDKYGPFWELPYLLPFGEKYILIVGVYSHARYWIGNFDKTTFVFIPDNQEANFLDVSTHFYAPNPHLVDYRGTDGGPRRLMFGWVRGGKSPTEGIPYWEGSHSLPRILTLQDNKLIQQPIPELQILRQEHMQVKNCWIDSKTTGLFDDFQGNALEIVVTFNLKENSANLFGVKLRMSKDNDSAILVYYDPVNNRFGIDGDVVDGNIYDRVELSEGQEITLHIFLDNSIIEVFASGRVITKRTFTDPMNRDFDIFANDGKVFLENMDVWQMKSIWKSFQIQ